MVPSLVVVYPNSNALDIVCTLHVHEDTKAEEDDPSDPH